MTTRRTLLAAAGALAALPCWSARAATPELRALLAVLAHRGSAEAVGRAYLTGHPLEADPQALLAGLRGDPLIGPALAATSRTGPPLDGAVAQSVRRDFLARRTVKVEGWVLSLTEARLCALTTLV